MSTCSHERGETKSWYEVTSEALNFDGKGPLDERGVVRGGRRGGLRAVDARTGVEAWTNRRRRATAACVLCWRWRLFCFSVFFPLTEPVHIRRGGLITRCAPFSRLRLTPHRICTYTGDMIELWIRVSVGIIAPVCPYATDCFRRFLTQPHPQAGLDRRHHWAH